MDPPANTLSVIISMFEEYEEVLLPTAGGCTSRHNIHNLQEIGALAATLRLHGLNLGNRAGASHLVTKTRNLKQVVKVISELAAT